MLIFTSTSNIPTIMSDDQKKAKKTWGARLRRFYRNSKRIFKISHKPTRKEYWLMMKICLVGFAILGVLAFIIHQIVTVVDTGATAGSSSSSTTAIGTIGTIFRVLTII